WKVVSGKDQEFVYFCVAHIQMSRELAIFHKLPVVQSSAGIEVDRRVPVLKCSVAYEQGTLRKLDVSFKIVPMHLLLRYSQCGGDCGLEILRHQLSSQRWV